MSKTRFAEQWDLYARKVLPVHAGRVQAQETRRAFYAGGASFLFLLMSSFTEDEEVTDQDLLTMSALKEEIQAFARDIAEGRA
jgi:hypothetical protein